MTNLNCRVSGLTFLLTSLLQATSAAILGQPDLYFAAPQAVEAANPRITAKPSPEVVDHLLERREELDPCAKACIGSAVVKYTTCTTDDLVCICQDNNVASIWLASSNCIVGCGVSVLMG